MSSTSLKLKAWRDDPILFVKENFGVIPDDWQAESLKAFPHTNRLAFVASKGVGKTTILSWMILNFISTRPSAKLACVSISFDNLSDGLRSEIAHWHSKKYLSFIIFYLN